MARSAVRYTCRKTLSPIAGTATFWAVMLNVPPTLGSSVASSPTDRNCSTTLAVTADVSGTEVSERTLGPAGLHDVDIAMAPTTTIRLILSASYSTRFDAVQGPLRLRPRRAPLQR